MQVPGQPVELDGGHAPADVSGAHVGRLKALLDVGRSLTAELNLDAVLDRVLETARTLTGARYAAIGVLDERRAQLDQFLTAGLSNEVRERIGELPHGRGVLGVLIDEPTPIRLHDVADHPQSFGFPPGHPPMHSFLGVPITIRGEAWGNLYLTEKDGGGDFDDADVQTTMVLAQWAAIAIDNAKLFGESERRRKELERALSGLEATVDVALALGDSTDLDRTLNLIAQRGRPLVRADELVICIRDAGALQIVARAGAHDGVQDERVDLEGSSISRLLDSLEPVRVDDLQAEYGIDPSWFGVPKVARAVLVPLVFRRHSVGMLAAFRTRDHSPFHEDDERALRALAASAATAVTTARTVAAQRLRSSIAAAESERKRWARELHDETLQGLGALKLALSAALNAPDPETQRATVESAARQLEQEIKGLRSVIRDLRPAVLDELGLVPALRALAERTSERGGIDVRTSFELEDERLGPEIETAAYRVIQEALTNVAKHSAASSATIAMRHEDGQLTISVTDDGVGLGHSESPAGEGFGVVGMRERAELIGGEVTLRSQPGCTEVELRVPLP